MSRSTISYIFIFFLCHCAVVVVHDANLAKWAGYNSTGGTGPIAHRGQDPLQKPDYAIKHKQFPIYFILLSRFLPKLSTDLINSNEYSNKYFFF